MLKSLEEKKQKRLNDQYEWKWYRPWLKKNKFVDNLWDIYKMQQEELWYKSKERLENLERGKMYAETVSQIYQPAISQEKSEQVEHSKRVIIN